MQKSDGDGGKREMKARDVGILPATGTPQYHTAHTGGCMCNICTISGFHGLTYCVVY